jgi:uncharacterized protein YecE (DUF72 family)
MDRLGVARVAADPPLSEAAAVPGGWQGLRYWRFHGSPAIYRSSYFDRIPQMLDLVDRFADAAETWCIFDNTASSAAMSDALSMVQQLNKVRASASPSRGPRG